MGISIKLQLVSKSWGMGRLYKLKISPSRLFINYKGKGIRGIMSDISLTKASKSSHQEWDQLTWLQIYCTEKDIIIISISAETNNLNLSMRKWVNVKLNFILPTIGVYALSKRWRIFRLKENKDTWQQNAT